MLRIVSASSSNTPLYETVRALEGSNVAPASRCSAESGPSWTLLKLASNALAHLCGIGISVKSSTESTRFSSPSHQTLSICVRMANSSNSSTRQKKKKLEAGRFKCVRSKKKQRCGSAQCTVEGETSASTIDPQCEHSQACWPPEANGDQRTAQHSTARRRRSSV
eukprot:6186831-Pleurochrysis_carterae.AAC.3